MELDHAGIATDDADSLADLYESVFETPIAHEETLNGLRVLFLEAGEAYFELLEPLPDAEGPIPRYLEERGAGVHHLAVRTDDIEVALTAAREAGVEPIDEEPREGAWGHEIAFLHPASTGGVLFEFVEH